MSEPTYTDDEGRRWRVTEICRVGTGARAEGDALPEPTHATLRFEADGETRWAQNPPLDWDHPDCLAELFEGARP
jgi:hypothetical protein